ncbi:MAG: substrate-binding domain-containing protein [Betaproteobacteria bacterium]|nr:substrate-binding domain-containing protein [Betaproteobacteria bacterium]
MISRRHLRSSIARFAIATAAVFAFSGPAMAQLKVMISGGFSHAYREVLPEFERTTGITVTTGSGASQGTGPLTIRAQLERGVPADVVIMSREGLQELVAAGKIAAGTDADLARAPLGAAARMGAPKPDLSTVDAFKRTITSAKAVAVPGSTAGIYFVKELLPRLGLVDKVNVITTERGSQAAEMAASGKADIAVQPASELMHVPGLEYAGKLPDEIQLIQVFSAATVTGSKQSQAAKQLIEFLASKRTAKAIEDSGLEPIHR